MDEVSRAGAPVAGVDTGDPPGARSAATSADLHSDPLDDDVGVTSERRSFLRELPVLIVIALVLALLIKAFLVQAFYIPSGSMEHTLEIRDRVLVNKVVYRFRDIHRGEIVVFNGLDSFTPEVSVPPPSNGFDSFRRRLAGAIGLGHPGERDFIKRVIGIPGDVVACCDAGGRVTVNGQALDEPYLLNDDRQPFPATKVDPGMLWVMGDHRSSSSDSRANGQVPIKRVVGRAFVVIWPPSRAKVLRVPDTFEGRRQSADPPVAGLSQAGAWSLALTPPVLSLALATPLTVLRRRRRARSG